MHVRGGAELRRQRFKTTCTLVGPLRLCALASLRSITGPSLPSIATGGPVAAERMMPKLWTIGRFRFQRKDAKSQRRKGNFLGSDALGGASLSSRVSCVSVCLVSFDAFFGQTLGRHRHPMSRSCHRFPASVSSIRPTPSRSVSVFSSRLMRQVTIGFISSGGTRAIGRRDTEQVGVALTTAAVTPTVWSALAISPPKR